MESPLKRLSVIAKAIENNKYADLGVVERIENDSRDVMVLKVIPHEGIHAKIPYIITVKFKENTHPNVYIDSEIYDKIKTPQYLSGTGRWNKEHRGICIKLFSHGNFTTTFEKVCNNKWSNYIYYLITFFNNIQDIEGGSGIKKNYKDIINMILNTS